MTTQHTTIDKQVEWEAYAEGRISGTILWDDTKLDEMWGWIYERNIIEHIGDAGGEIFEPRCSEQEMATVARLIEVGAISRTVKTGYSVANLALTDRGLRIYALLS